MTDALRTSRLLLRQWRDDDVAAFAELSADPAVMQYLVPFADSAAMDAWVAAASKHWQDHGFGPWVVELPDEAPMIGVVGLSNLRFALPFAPAVEAAWRLAHRYWGRGYAYEAARVAIDDGCGRLGLDEIVAFTVPANRRSWELMRRLGMTRDPADDFDHPRVPPGDPLRRHVLYRITRAAWRAPT